MNPILALPPCQQRLCEMNIRMHQAETNGTLFLKDAGIEVKDIRYAWDETWPKTSEKLVQQGLTRTGKLPVLEYKGLKLSQHIPILRYLARELGSYDGVTSVEKFTVDSVADLYVDWRASTYEWVACLPKPSDDYKASRPKYVDLIAQYYADTEGPYLLGDKITYADFAIYQSIDNDKRVGAAPPGGHLLTCENQATLPQSLLNLVEAIEARPNIAAYLKENKTA
ncbi:unnamed protein product [Clonostachys rosea f. rosea IK726]|uniref:Uncharacterized protein n=1 Tax=Clonostachys rosea f. rosea IK726 TaxID=1349383 RepID=A0ACA9U6B9_BIOOC|nr:unnamed protein product [Clonostachys rosea f. rosea IK726]